MADGTAVVAVVRPGLASGGLARRRLRRYQLRSSATVPSGSSARASATVGGDLLCLYDNVGLLGGVAAAD